MTGPEPHSGRICQDQPRLAFNLQNSSLAVVQPAQPVSGLQRRLHQLPTQLWAEVLDHLHLTDLLQARLVCKDFIRLDQTKGLSMTWRIDDESAASSLMLFLTRHCSSPGSAPVDITIGDLPHNAVWPGIMMASSCINLQRLECTSLQLDMPVAQACLRLLPPTLRELELLAPAKIVDEPCWSRSTALSNLLLERPSGLSLCSYHGSGLAQLPALSHLTLDVENTAAGSDLPGDKLLGTSFAFPHLTVLSFNLDPFEGGPDLCKLPALEIIHVSDPSATLPKWLAGQACKTLDMCSSAQLKSVRMSDLRCSSLCITHAASDPSWRVADLLQMPCLQSFKVIPDSDSDDHQLRLIGSLSEYMAFLSVAVDLEVPTKFRLQDAVEGDGTFWLNQCGHAKVCICAKCKPNGNQMSAEAA